jgi:hypothetical protein
LLGNGRRLFDGLPPEHIDLELMRQLTPDVEDLAHRVTHLRYRVAVADARSSTEPMLGSTHHPSVVTRASDER